MVHSDEILNAAILVVDDNRASVRLLERMLRGAGYLRVESTTQPGEVCELHRRNHYDLIMLDLQMPDMDGFQVMEGLKAIEAGAYLPVFVITAQSDQKLRALRTGARDFVGKPFELSEVLARVHNMLEVRLLLDAARSQGRVQESLALHDPLTGLANRRLLAEKMSMALAHARRNKTAMAVVCMDLDGFKPINDTLGHAAGDVVLKTVAMRLLASVREEDTVARLGGDEFVVALWHVGDATRAATVASKIVAAVSQPFVIEGRAVSVTISAGIGVYPVHGEDPETLMKSADLALYEAKRAGKNTYRISERTAGAPTRTEPPALDLA